MKKLGILHILYIVFILFSCKENKPSMKEYSQFIVDIKNCNTDGVKEALKKYPEIAGIGSSFEEENLCFPIHIAVATDNPEIVKLVVHPKTINYCIAASGEGYSPLYYAVDRQASPEIVSILLESGADVSMMLPDLNWNIFHTFANISKKRNEMWESLKKYSTPELLNTRDIYSWTPIMHLICSDINLHLLETDEAACLLEDFIKHGANPNLIQLDEYFNEETLLIINNYASEKYKKVLYDGIIRYPAENDNKKLMKYLESVSVTEESSKIYLSDKIEISDNEKLIQITYPPIKIQ